MSQYMMLVYEEEVDPAVQAEREKQLPVFVELHRSLREAGLLGGRPAAAFGAERDVLAGY
jgi:hypothetical protein